MCIKYYILHSLYKLCSSIWKKTINENSIANKIILKLLKVPWFRTVEGLDLHDETKYGLFH